MSGKYVQARNEFGEGRLSWTDDAIVAQLLSTEYRFSEDHTVGDLSGYEVGQGVELRDRAIVDGWLTCGNPVFQQVSGDQVAAIVFLRARDSLLIEYHDAIENFPLHPNGGDIEIRISQPGIFRL